MSVTLSSLPGKFKYSLLNVFCPDGITLNAGLTGPNNAHTPTHPYIHIYIYMCVGGWVSECACVCVGRESKKIYIYIERDRDGYMDANVA